MTIENATQPHRSASRVSGKFPTRVTRSERRDMVYNAIDGEREYQDIRWGHNPPLRIGEFILLLDEYVTRAKLSWSQEKQPPEYPEYRTMSIIRKIAGIAVHAMEARGIVEREDFERQG